MLGQAELRMLLRRALVDVSTEPGLRLKNCVLPPQAPVEPKELVATLESAGSEERFGALHAVRSSIGYTILHYAASNGAVEILEGVLKLLSTNQRCDLLRIQSGTGRTALHQAGERGHTAALQCILECTDVNQRYDLLKIQDRNGHTPFSRAAENGHLETVQCMLWLSTADERYNMLRIQNFAGSTMVHLAAGKADLDQLTCLLQMLSQDQIHNLLKIRDGESKTAAHWGAEVGQVDTVKLLLSGFSANQVYDLMQMQALNGWTPLHVAAYGNHTDIIKYVFSLLTATQWTDLKEMHTRSGDTAVDLAHHRNHTIAELCLLETKSPAEEQDLIPNAKSPECPSPPNDSKISWKTQNEDSGLGQFEVENENSKLKQDTEYLIQENILLKNRITQLEASMDGLTERLLTGEDTLLSVCGELRKTQQEQSDNTAIKITALGKTMSDRVGAASHSAAAGTATAMAICGKLRSNQQMLYNNQEVLHGTLNQQSLQVAGVKRKLAAIEDDVDHMMPAGHQDQVNDGN